jgi:hypothetical protein
MPPKRTAPRESGGKKNRRKRARTKNSTIPSNVPNAPNAAPLHSLLGGSDNQPLSKLNRPRPKSSAKKKRGKHIFLESDDPLEKVSSILEFSGPKQSLSHLLEHRGQIPHARRLYLRPKRRCIHHKKLSHQN